MAKKIIEYLENRFFAICTFIMIIFMIAWKLREFILYIGLGIVMVQIIMRLS